MDPIGLYFRHSRTKQWWKRNYEIVVSGVLIQPHVSTWRKHRLPGARSRYGGIIRKLSIKILVGFVCPWRIFLGRNGNMYYYMMVRLIFIVFKFTVEYTTIDPMDFILFILRTKVLIFKPIKILMINHESPVFIAEMMVLTNPVPVNEVLFVEHVCFLLWGGGSKFWDILTKTDLVGAWDTHLKQNMSQLGNHFHQTGETIPKIFKITN